MRRYNSILWKIKEEIEMMTENYEDILRVFRFYRLSSAYRPPVMILLFLMTLNNAFEENAELLPDLDKYRYQNGSGRIRNRSDMIFRPS
jgi:hypothetical protein